MSKQILVLGSNGKTGRRVAERLHQLQIPFRPGSRNGQPAFDWDKPENWPQVLKGIETVYITFQPDLAVPQAAKKIECFAAAAKADGVKKLVLLSGRGEPEAQVCEQWVKDSGLLWTIVRASWFMQNFSENFLLDPILRNEMVLPLIRAKEPFVDADDIADVVVETLISDKHTNQIYELTGPELLSFQQAVSLIGAATGRNITYTEISIDDYVAALQWQQVPGQTIWLIRYLFTKVLDGRNESITHDVEKLLGRKPIFFQEFVSKTENTGIWQA